MFNTAQMMIEEQKPNNSTETAILPMQCYVQGGLQKRYSVIYADPAWSYDFKEPTASKGGAKGSGYSAGVDYYYVTMTIEQIMKLPVADICEKDAVLFLWATNPLLPEALETMKAWGFKYCQTLTWCKTPMGTGQGGVYCPTTEFLILGRKGKMPKVKRIDTTWWNVKRAWKTHSKKPEFFQDLIETVSDAPRLEMFARRERKNRDVWGNEVESSVAL